MYSCRYVLMTFSVLLLYRIRIQDAHSTSNKPDSLQSQLAIVEAITVTYFQVTNARQPANQCQNRTCLRKYANKSITSLVWIYLCYRHRNDSKIDTYLKKRSERLPNFISSASTNLPCTLHTCRINCPV